MSAVLRKYMQAKKITQSQLSKMLGCVPSTVHSWLFKNKRPRFYSAKKLAMVSRGEVPISTWGWVEEESWKVFRTRMERK